jgi:RNA polymerase sigma-70 factor (sigma-E family)
MTSTPDDFAAAFPALAAIAHRVAFRILGDQGDAEDVAQETLARALVRWRRIAGYAEPWTATTSSNLAIGIWRRRSRGKGMSIRQADTVDEYSHDRMELVRLLRGLPRRQRDVVVLRYLADLSEAAVAEALGCSVGSVKQHAHRGLAALRLAIDPTRGGAS